MKNALIGNKFPLENMENHKSEWNELEGKPTLINLWFTNCYPCLEEIPKLNAIKKKYASKAYFIAITFDNEAKVQQLLQTRAFNFKQWTGEKRFLKELGINTYPVNILLDKNGIVVKIEGGIPLDSSGDELARDLEELL